MLQACSHSNSRRPWPPGPRPQSRRRPRHPTRSPTQSEPPLKELDSLVALLVTFSDSPSRWLQIIESLRLDALLRRGASARQCQWPASLRQFPMLLRSRCRSGSAGEPESLPASHWLGSDRTQSNGKAAARATAALTVTQAPGQVAGPWIWILGTLGYRMSTYHILCWHTLS